ncbi:MAG: hypothetical protein ACK5LS_00180 [Propioniciclava sp.]
MDFHEAHAELDRIQPWKHGVTRTAATESVVRRIEAEGPREVMPRALIDLVEAYSFTDQTAPGFAAFARLLRLWDESPEIFDDLDTRNMFWEFKWIANDLADVRQISREQASAFFDDMRRRFAAAGYGSSAILLSEFRVAWNSGDADADVRRRAWLASGRDKFDDCRACRIGNQVRFFLDQGRHIEAVELGLTQDSSCNREPAATLHALALAQVLAGDGAGAGETYRAALASVDRHQGLGATSRGHLFEALGRGGALDEALAYLRDDDPGVLVTTAPELHRLRLLMSVVAGLSAHPDAADTPTFLPLDGVATVGELRSWAITEAGPIADALDHRNGNTVLAAKLAAAEQAGLAPEPLILAPVVVTQTPEGSTPTDTPAELASARPADPPDAESLAAELRFAEAATAYETQAAAREASGLLSDAGLSWAEAAVCHDENRDRPAAHDAYRRGVALLMAGGAEPSLSARVLATWAPLAFVSGDSSAVLDPLEQLLRRVSTSEDTETTAVLLDTKARVLASLPAADRAPGRDLETAAEAATGAAEAFAQAGEIADAAESFWVAGRVLSDAGLSERAVWALESAFEGFSLARRSDRRLDVADALVTELRASGQDARVEEFIRKLNQH